MSDAKNDAPGGSIYEILGLADSAKVPPGYVEIGGWFGQPHLSLSFARAARTLYDAAGPSAGLTEVIAPIFYSARHAVELALKDLLMVYQSNLREQAALDEHDGKPTSEVSLPDKVLDRLSKTHDLGELLEWVRQAMPAYVKPNWGELVRLIAVYEEGSPERFRYDRIGPLNKKKGTRPVQSFEKRVVIPIADILNELERFMNEAAAAPVDRFSETSDWSALYDLGLESQLLTEALYARGLLF